MTTLPALVARAGCVMPVPAGRRSEDAVSVVKLSICSVPAGLVTAAVEIGSIAGTVARRSRYPGPGRRHREVGSVLAGRDRVASQCIGAGAAGARRRCRHR